MLKGSFDATLAKYKAEEAPIEEIRSVTENSGGIPKTARNSPDHTLQNQPP